MDKAPADDFGPLCSLDKMAQNAMHLGQVATVVIPVTDQEEALAFYVGILGMQKVSDFTYPSGERWLEVSPAEGSSNLCLIGARSERPAGIETGVMLFSADVLADLATLRAQGVDVDERPLPEGEVVWWSGAPLAGVPTQFRLRDGDNNSFLIVAAP
jgi:lactoylglutathione lyase